MCHRLYRPGYSMPELSTPPGRQLDLPGDLVELARVERLGCPVHAHAPGGQVTGLVHVGLAVSCRRRGDQHKGGRRTGRSPV